MKVTAAGAGYTCAAAPNLAVPEKKSINPELWQACAGPLVNLPAAGTLVVYFPQGHSEQVAASMKNNADAQTPNYPNLPSNLLCLLHNVTLHADPETDGVYAQMTLQPVSSFDNEALLRSDLSLKSNKPQPDFFCKTLTASDTSTHGGFSVPRRAAEKIFPPLDFSMQPPAQELVARDLHENVWNFRHIYRGQPKRHLLTTGWSLFVSGKRLFAGDSVLFIRDERQQLLLGIRRANRQPTNLSSSVLSSDSMHIGILAEAAHAAENKSPFSVFYNPRASPSEFVIPLAKYYKAVYNNQISHGMRFRMMFDTEESGTRRYKGTITAINDIDPVRWKNSQWRNLQVGWDESTAEERRSRVSIWEIEPITTPFFIFPPPFFRSNCLTQHGIPGVDLKSLVVDSNAKEKNSRFLQLSKEQHVFNRYAPVVEEGINEEYNVEVVAEPNLASMALEDTHSSKLKGISTMSFEEIKRRALRRKAPISAKIVPGTSPFSSLPSKSVKLTPDATPGVDSGVSLTFPIDFLSRDQGVSISRADADKLLFPAPRLQLSALPPGQVGDEGSTLLIHALQHSLMTRQNIHDLEFELVVLKEKAEGTVDSWEKAKERAERAECLLLTKDIEVRELRERIALLTEEAKDVESFIIMKTRAQLFKQFLEGKSATWDAQGELDFFLENVGDMADLASSVKDDGDDDTTREEGASSADSSFDANMVVEIAEDCDMDA